MLRYQTKFDVLWDKVMAKTLVYKDSHWTSEYKCDMHFQFFSPLN